MDINSKFSHLPNLLIFIQHLFKNQIKMEFFIKMSELEQKIFKNIVERKYGKIIEFTKDNKEMKKRFKHLIQSTSSKRPEESYKFVFKRCLKHMKDELKHIVKQKQKMRKK